MPISRRNCIVFSLILLSGCGEREPTSTTSRPCIYVRSVAGEGYALGYARQRCSKPGYPDLPTRQYDPLAAWAYNAQAAGFLAPIDQFRIVARLATRDHRSESGFSVHGDGFWREYKWAEWVREADLISLDALKNDTLVAAIIETPLSRAALGAGHGQDLKMVSRRLSGSVVSSLIPVLSAAEGRLVGMDSLRRVERTMEDAIRERPDHAMERRKTFTQFRIE